MSVPFGFPFTSFKRTTALSANLIRSPVRRLYSFLCLTSTASKTFPFIFASPLRTDILIRSETPQNGFLPFTVFPLLRIATTLTIFAPLLSQAIASLPRVRPIPTSAFIAFILHSMPGIPVFPDKVCMHLYAVNGLKNRQTYKSKPLINSQRVFLKLMLIMLSLGP